MIERLHIENYLLIDSLEIKFDKGLNIITGETGAGKSILLGAISMLLGGKNDKRTVNKGDKNSSIEAVFDIDKYNLQPLFEQYDLEYDAVTTISRIITPSGKSRSYINDLPVTISVLKIVGEHLVDIHSQHQTLLLSQENFQLDIVDLIANNGDAIISYSKYYADIKSEKALLVELRESTLQNIKDQEYVMFQLDQLERAELREGELQELEETQLFLSSASQIKESFFNATEQINKMDGAVVSTLKNICSSFDKIADVSTKAAELGERLYSVLYELKDIDVEVDRYLDKIDADPNKLEQIDSRIDILNTLMQKHGLNSEKELISLKAEYEERLLNINLGSTHIEQSEKRIEELSLKAIEISDHISARRRAVLPQIESYVVEMLADLGMESCRFNIDVESVESLLSSGRDKVKFMFSANKGMSLKPIDKVASGGEMSRVMLVLKSLTAKHKALPSIIFDEIDTGVSGRVADKMGSIMKKLSSTIQTICITHLPQVAAKGNCHIFVSKQEAGDVTTTDISILSDDDRIEVVAKMLSGSDVTQAARDQATLLIGGE